MRTLCSRALSLRARTLSPRADIITAWEYDEIAPRVHEVDIAPEFIAVRTPCDAHAPRESLRTPYAPPPPAHHTSHDAAVFSRAHVAPRISLTHTCARVRAIAPQYVQFAILAKLNAITFATKLKDELPTDKPCGRLAYLLCLQHMINMHAGKEPLSEGIAIPSCISYSILARNHSQKNSRT